MILFCHFANSTSFGPLQSTCWFPTWCWILWRNIADFDLFVWTHHPATSPPMVDHQMHSWLPIKDPEIEDRFQNSPCLKKIQFLQTIMLYQTWKITGVGFVYRRFVGAKLSFPGSFGHMIPSPRIAPRSSGLGYVGWEPKKWERRSITGITRWMHVCW